MSGLLNKVNLKLFLEEFFDGLKYQGGEYKEIYINPTSSEMDEVAEVLDPSKGFGETNAWMKYETEKAKYIRFTATKNKKVYVFSPWVLHEDLDRKFGIDQYSDVFIHGIARKINGKWTATEMHNVEYVFREKKEADRRSDYAKTDWSWLDKYITTTPLYNKIIREYSTNPNTTKFKRMAT